MKKKPFVIANVPSTTLPILEQIASLSELSDFQFFQWKDLKTEAPAIQIFRTDGTIVSLNSVSDFGEENLFISLYSWIYDNRLPLMSKIHNLSELQLAPFHVILVLSREASHTPESEKALFSLFEETEIELRSFKGAKRAGFWKEREELSKQLQELKQTLVLDFPIIDQRRELRKEIALIDIKIDHIRRDWIFHWLYKEDNIESLPRWGLQDSSFPTWLVYHNYTFYNSIEPLSTTTKASIKKELSAVIANKTIPFYFSEPSKKGIDFSVLKDPVFKITGKSVRFYLNPVMWPYEDDWGVPSDVFLLVYSSSDSETENRFLQLWTRFAERIKDVNHILVAKIDVAKNWVPFSVKRIPRVIFFPSQSKDQPVEYFDDFHIEKLIHFSSQTTSFRGLLPWKNRYPESARAEDRKLEQELSFRPKEDLEGSKVSREEL
eukprot:TRINITY_DN3632_c0_g1_i1.p1 TRINITY_DN3632_c0_g1~~TRINITY_DN3632_c0_g1_i1.p1  ORF type:complete len:435 (-),score=82.64 TRINITY_DN3632_c0_g1_i1:605-1909(-)